MPYLLAKTATILYLLFNNTLRIIYERKTEQRCEITQKRELFTKRALESNFGYCAN